MIVVDASILLRASMKTPAAAAAAAAVGRADAIAPDIILAEVANGLWRYVRAGEMQPAAAAQLLDAATLAVSCVPVSPELLADALRIACTARHPVYDCIYLALALERRAGLVTADLRLAEHARRMRISVELLP